MVSFAQRLEKLRTEKNISRVELAGKMGLPKLSVEKFETGRLTPSKDQQLKLAKFFGVSVEYLQGISDDPADMSSWLSGEIKEEEPAKPAYRPEPKKVVSESGGKTNEDNAVYNLLLKSESFREAVLNILRSPEGQELIAKAAKSRRL